MGDKILRDSVENIPLPDNNLENNAKLLPPGMEITTLDALKNSTPGTFWDYCPDIVIFIIGIGLAMITTGLGYIVWKIAANNSFIR